MKWGVKFVGRVGPLRSTHGQILERMLKPRKPQIIMLAKQDAWMEIGKVVSPIAIGIAVKYALAAAGLRRRNPKSGRIFEIIQNANSRSFGESGLTFNKKEIEYLVGVFNGNEKKTMDFLDRARENYNGLMDIMRDIVNKWFEQVKATG